MIYFINLIVLTVLLVLASPHVTCFGFGRELFDNTVNFSVWVWSMIR